jgi:glycosyltransferase involved in cell wall biosynthesis
MSSLSIVVPIYNESRTIETIVAEIRKLPTNVVKETIFVNDGSTDDSEEKLQLALSLKPMRHILISKKKWR